MIVILVLFLAYWSLAYVAVLHRFAVYARILHALLSNRRVAIASAQRLHVFTAASRDVYPSAIMSGPALVFFLLGFGSAALILASQDMLPKGFLSEYRIQTKR